MRHIIPISGKDSLATAIWQTAHEPNLPYEFVFNDTRAELPETYEWLDSVEQKLGIKITRIGKSLEQIIAEQGMLPSARMRFCTKYSKIFPMNHFLNGDKAICYFGLRSDEQGRSGAIETKKFTPRYPLREAGIGIATVYRIVRSRDLMPPAFFWQRLWEEVTRQVGEPRGWPDWLTARTFAWRSRPNCFFCFFQRRYEWVGLLWHHPALFSKAEEIEARSNGDRREKAFFWIQDCPLSVIREEAEIIFALRVEAVCRMIDAAKQDQLFGDAMDEMDIAGASCGLLCGK